jgi:hypothetical protein
MRMKQLGSSLLLCTAFSLSTASVWAQDPAPAAAEPAETFPPAWFRIDSDAGLLQLWAGATHALSDTVGLATDIYVNSGSLGEFDIGPAFTASSFIVTPMLGMQFDWVQKKAAAIVPQLYVVGGPDPIYAELWVQNYLYSPFDYASDGGDTPNRSTLYFRLFVDYKATKYIAIGPQIEPLLALSGEGDTLIGLPIGLSVALLNYGVGNTLFAFLGIETQDASKGPDGEQLAGRLTFVKNF